jgi:Mn2+/Fe2+ NRAMP family transporter
MVHAKKSTKIIPIEKSFFKILIIFIIPAFILIILKSFLEANIFNFISLSVLFFSLYFLLIFLMKGLDKEDLIIIHETKNRFRKRLNNNFNIMKDY